MRLRVRRGRPLMKPEGRAASPAAGLHAYRPTDGDSTSRVHLRIEPDGQGLLLVNANRAFHLNPTAAALAWFALEGRGEPEAVAFLRRRYRVSPRTAREDFAVVRSQLRELVRPDGACPIHEMDFELQPPFSHIPSAPYRMDLALTYRCNNDCSHCYNARPREYPELTTRDWTEILDRLWAEGVPHICFTGGEATLRDDLPELVAHAESLGQITGLLTNGRRLADRGYVSRLVQAGLDHVQITLESHAAEIHDRMVRCRGAWRQTVEGVRNALESRLFVMTNTTLLADNAPTLDQTLVFLSELGVPTIGLNGLIRSGSGSTVGTGVPEEALRPLLETARAHTVRSGQRLIWYTPTQYCHFDPVQMELGVKACTAASYNLCVEPDGAVIPCQSYYESLGNLLSEPWEAIWNHDLARGLRERRYAPAHCADCALLRECGGGCPLSLAASLPAALAATTA
jgi:radical SAM protein with 4Fe4S-binding SPASM domain